MTLQGFLTPPGADRVYGGEPEKGPFRRREDRYMQSGLEAILADCVHATSSGEEFWSSVSGHIRDLIPFDAAGWFGIDPSTLIVNFPVRVENIEPGHCQTYWERESKVNDALLFRDLAKSQVPAGTLYSATGNRPHLSPRYREYLAPQNFDDELRAAFRIRGRTWGVAGLYRNRGRNPFTERDVAVFTEVSTAIAGALRGMAIQGQATITEEAARGTALFDHGGCLISFDDQAEHWFTEIGGPHWADRPPSMAGVWAVVYRALNVHEGRDWGPSLVRLRTRNREWVTLSASVLRGMNGSMGPVALSVSRSGGWDIAPLLVEAHGLTPREQQVCEGVARGLSNQEIAAEFSLSPHTVRDHLKAVFAKVGVTSRGELTAKLFSDFYKPRLHAPGADVVRVYT